jgi:uncharacterized protein (TIGR02147 family)
MSSNIDKKISIYDFRSFGDFFAAYVENAKSTDKKISFGYIAKRLHINSRSILAMIASGQRQPSKEVFEKLSSYLSLSYEEKTYAHLLVACDASDDLSEKKLRLSHLEQMRPTGTVQELSPQIWDEVFEWYFPAIFELTLLKDFTLEPSWIARKLHFEVSHENINSALDVMLKLGLLNKNSAGQLTKTHANIQTPSEIPFAIGRRVHHKFLSLASQSLETQEVSKRQISGTTIAIDSKKLRELKKLILEFERSFEKLAQTSENVDSVYHLEVAFFALTD